MEEVGDKGKQTPPCRMLQTATVARFCYFLFWWKEVPDGGTFKPHATATAVIYAQHSLPGRSPPPCVGMQIITQCNWNSGHITGSQPCRNPAKELLDSGQRLQQRLKERFKGVTFTKLLQVGKLSLPPSPTIVLRSINNCGFCPISANCTAVTKFLGPNSCKNKNSGETRYGGQPKNCRAIKESHSMHCNQYPFFLSTSPCFVFL